MNTGECDAVAAQFCVTTSRVEQDHLISHLLAALSEHFGERVLFIGGTALARTHLPNGRFSEDIDLIALGDRSTVAAALDGTIPRSLARSRWSTERRNLVQRYSDAPATELIVPTLPAFVAGKTATWHDRHAPRDLWDLWALNNIGAIDDAAAVMYRRHGPTFYPVRICSQSRRRKRTGSHSWRVRPGSPLLRRRRWRKSGRRGSA